MLGKLSTVLDIQLFPSTKLGTADALGRMLNYTFGILIDVEYLNYAINISFHLLTIRPCSIHYDLGIMGKWADPDPFWAAFSAAATFVLSLVAANLH